jgi:hypothetical protein
VEGYLPILNGPWHAKQGTLNPGGMCKGHKGITLNPMPAYGCWKRTPLAIWESYVEDYLLILNGPWHARQGTLNLGGMCQGHMGITLNPMPA